MVAQLFKRINKLIDVLMDHELRTAQLLFLIISLGFGLFAIFGDNLPIKGPVSHVTLNVIDGLVALIIFIGLIFSPLFQRNYQLCAYVFMYLMNTINIYLLYGTSFHFQYAYQFIVAYAISGWFFRSRKAYYIHTIVINVLLLVTILVSEKGSTNTFDFYATYVVASFAQVILIHFRFSVEDKMKESELKYRLLAENSYDLIVVHNSDGKMTFVSPSVKRLLGYDPDELIGRRPYEIVHSDDKHIIRNLNLKETNHPSVQHPVQYRLQHKDGSYIWIETIFVPLENHDGQNDVVLSQTRDIRRSKNYQLQLEERTKELERSNADLETFAFVSSHDMQEPLRMISNYMQLLKRKYSDKLDEEAREYIEFANKGAITLSQLIRDLLSYSRITRAEIKRSEVDMNKLVNEVLSNIQLQLQERNAEVKADKLCSIQTDRNMLMLVIQNLILNGVKYNTSEKPFVSVTCRKDDGQHIFCIRDNGIGIAKEHQSRIFEPFHRLHTKNEYPGTGLGLSICKKIVERLDGKLWLESEPGKGSAFYFSLPVV